MSVPAARLPTWLARLDFSSSALSRTLIATASPVSTCCAYFTLAKVPCAGPS